MFEDKVRRLLEAHRQGQITDDECQDEIAILHMRALAMPPILLDQATMRIAALARKRPGSAMNGGENESS